MIKSARAERRLERAPSGAGRAHSARTVDFVGVGSDDLPAVRGHVAEMKSVFLDIDGQQVAIGISTLVAARDHDLTCAA